MVTGIIYCEIISYLLEGLQGGYVRPKTGIREVHVLLLIIAAWTLALILLRPYVRVQLLVWLIGLIPILVLLVRYGIRED